MKRRDFIGFAAGMPAAAVMPMVTASSSLAHIKSRKPRRVDVEMAFRSPHRRPNGLQATAEGLWVLDEYAPNYVSLVSYADGEVIREFTVDGLDGPGGITVDGDDVWINDTHNATIVRVSAQDGTLRAKYWNHGQGPGYRMPSDPPRVNSPLPPAYPPPEPSGGGGGGGGGGPRLPYGQISPATVSGLRGNGGQGMEFRDGLLYHASLYTRRLWVVEPSSWEVHAVWNLPGDRAHGMGWDPSGDSLWQSDTNLRSFFRHDLETGEIVEQIELTPEDPAVHGATVHDGHMWYCDDMGYICNFPL